MLHTILLTYFMQQKVWFNDRYNVIITLQLGFLDDSVWADGLLVFYEVFRYLEGAMIRLRNTKIGLLPLSELQRTEAFERDLDHYLGKGWRKNYSPRYCRQATYSNHMIML